MKIEKHCYNCNFRKIQTYDFPCNKCFYKFPLYPKWQKRDDIKNEN